MHEDGAFNNTFEVDNIGVDGDPIMIIPKFSMCRRFTSLILRNAYYDYFIMMVIFVNTITLALDSPLVPPQS